MTHVPVWKLPEVDTESREDRLLNRKLVENRRVLVVEDEPEINEAYKSILSPADASVIPMKRTSRQMNNQAPSTESLPRFGFELTVVATAAEALRVVDEAVHEGRPFAVGFFDVLLGPGMDGVELVRRIHDLDPEMYAVFVTAYNDRSVESINKLLGEDKSDRWDYLNKPFSEGEIYQKARNAVTFWNVTHQSRQRELDLADLRQKVLEQEKSASVAALARSVGHEFGNILMQIMGRADLSRQGNEEQMSDALEMILKASVAASKILDRFKSLSRSYDVGNEKSVLHLSQPLREAFELLEHQIDKMEVAVDIRDDLQVKVLANHFSLVQVFMNLIINALDAMNEGPRAINVEISEHEGQAKLVFYDKGQGIPLEILESVSQPFFTTKEHKGTGLGLAICREIIEIEHGGRFLIGNHPQWGAQFTICLPILVDDAREVQDG